MLFHTVPCGHTGLAFIRAVRVTPHQLLEKILPGRPANGLFLSAYAHGLNTLTLPPGSPDVLMTQQ